MKKKILSILLIGVMVIGLTGCGNSNKSTITNNTNDKTSLSAEEKALKEDGYTKSIDSSDFDLDCFDNIKYHFDDNIFISNNGSVCLVNYEKAFSKSKKNTLKLDSKLNDIVYGAKIYDNTYYFITDKGTYKLDDNYNFVSVDSNELNRVEFRGSEIYGAIEKTDFDSIFYTNSNYFVLKNGDLYTFNYVNVYENLGDYGTNYVLYQDDHKIETNEEIKKAGIIDYMRSSFDGDLIITNDGYYKKTIINQEEVDKYNDVDPIYDYSKLNISSYKSNIKFISPNYIIINNNIYRYLPKELQ